MIRTAILIAATLLLHGCTYAISSPLAEKADRNIAFERFSSHPDLFQGKLIILGGTITQFQVMRQGTLLEVAYKPLDYWGKPERTRRVSGSFFVFHRGPLNPLAYAPGADITIAGEVLRPNDPVLGNTLVDLPVILTREHRIWSRERQTGDKPQWMDPLYDPDSPAKRD